MRPIKLTTKKKHAAQAASTLTGTAWLKKIKAVTSLKGKAVVQVSANQLQKVMKK